MCIMAEYSRQHEDLKGNGTYHCIYNYQQLQGCEGVHHHPHKLLWLACLNKSLSERCNDKIKAI